MAITFSTRDPRGQSNAVWNYAAPASGPAQPAQPARAAAAPMENTAQTDPYLDRQASRVEDRLAHFGDSTGRAIDQAGTKIRDAAEGQASAIAARNARKGTFDSGAMAQQQAEADYGTTRAIDSAAADITAGREKDYDQLLLGATGTLAAPGSAARADRAINLQQWESTEAGRRADDASALARQMAILNALGSVPQPAQYTNPGGYHEGVSFDPYGGGGGGGGAGALILPGRAPGLSSRRV